jgi:hypothetical protein
LPAVLILLDLVSPAHPDPQPHDLVARLVARDISEVTPEG